MVMHARSGGSLEVMGVMQGYVDGTTFVITDAFRLPVEGTETRVNAQDEANEYLVEYLRLSREQGRMENIVGWYHSHPGYGCWLSGIDVGTQQMQQKFNEPFVAVVIDPDRTISAGKVEIGAFRTYPENYKPPEEGGGGGGGGGGATASDGYQTVPLAKAEDFGAHASRYYSLGTEHFKSTLDAHLLDMLWNKYWVQTLSQSPLLTNRDYGNKQMLDLGSKIKEAVALMQRTGRSGPSLGYTSSSGPGKALEQTVEKLAQDSNQVTTREKSALMAGEIKAKVFNPRTDPPSAAA